MPKNNVTDPSPDQEMAFAHLIMSGTMTDRQAAEAVGLNPDTAAYIKAKPRVRDYMIKHRAAVRETLEDQEAQGHCNLNFSRDQILNRLWELAALSHEATRGSIVGQMKALALIAAIEGLIPDRRLSPSRAQPAAPPVEADIYKAKWLREQQHQPDCEEPGDPSAATEPQPDASLPEPAPSPAPQPAAAEPPSPSEPDFAPNQPSLAGSLASQASNWVPQATGRGFDALLDSRQPFSIQKGRFGRRR